jgi:hypothetical protein
MHYLSPANVLKSAALAALLFSSCAIVSAQNADSKKIAELFSEVKLHASHAEDDAQKLESFTRSPSISWQGHAAQLSLIRQHVNDLLSDYNEMARLRDEGSPWQQEAIDQLRPVLKGMADHLKATVDHQRENPTRVKMPPWVEYVRGNSEYATKASALIHDLVDYGAARSAADSLEQQLKLPAQARAD